MATDGIFFSFRIPHCTVRWNGVMKPRIRVIESVALGGVSHPPRHFLEGWDGQIGKRTHKREKAD